MLAVRNGTIVTMNPARTVFRPGTVLIEDSQIAGVGPSASTPVPRGATQVDAEGTIVVPGFINAHTHASGILLRGGPSRGRSFLDWLFNVTYPGLAAFTVEDVRSATLLYALEALKSGITTVVDNRDPGRSGDWEDHLGAAAAGYGRAGIRAVCAQMFYDAPLTDPELNQLLDRTMAMEPSVRRGGWVHWTTDSRIMPADEEAIATDAILRRLEAVITRFDETQGGLIRVWPAPARPALVSDRALRAAHELAVHHDTKWTTHLMDHSWDRRDPGESNTQRLADLGLVGDRLLAAHCLGVDSRGVRTLADGGAKATTQTTSLCYLGEKPGPVPALLMAGVDVGIGTDDPNLNDSVDMFQEMKFLTCVQRCLEGSPRAMAPEDALEMATIAGARAVGMDREVGSIEVGKQADLAVIEARHPRLSPMHDVASSLVFQASAELVRTVIIGGRVVLDGGRPTWLSEPEELSLYREAQERSNRVLDESGIAAAGLWPIETG